PYASPTVGWAPVAEEVNVVLKRLKIHPFLLRLLLQNLRAVLALSQSGNLKPAVQKVGALGKVGVVGMSHMVKGRLRLMVVHKEDKLMVELLLGVVIKPALLLRRDVVGLGAWDASLSEHLFGLKHGNAREGALWHGDVE